MLGLLSSERGQWKAVGKAARTVAQGEAQHTGQPAERGPSSPLGVEQQGCQDSLESRHRVGAVHNPVPHLLTLQKGSSMFKKFTKKSPIVGMVREVYDTPKGPLVLSVVAGSGAYCHPREDNPPGGWEAAEVALFYDDNGDGFLKPSDVLPQEKHGFDHFWNGGDSVGAYIPVDIIDDLQQALRACFGTPKYKL